MDENHDTNFEGLETEAPLESQKKTNTFVVQAFENVGKHIREGSSAAATIAGINILIGAAILLAFDFMPETLGMFASDPTAGIYYIIYGLIYLVMAVGIYKRSRICAFLAMAVFAFNLVYTFIGGDILDNLNYGNISMNIFIFLAFFHSLRYCLKFRKLAREHEDTDDSEITEIIETRPKMNTSRAVVYALLAIIGVGVGIWGFAGSGGGRNFEDWTLHQEGAITMRVPSERVTTEAEDMLELPGTSFIVIESSARGVEVELLRTVGFAALSDLIPASAMEDVAQELMHYVAEEMSDHLETSSGRMLGLPFQSVAGRYRERRPFEFRALIIDHEIYIVGIMVSREDDMDLFTQFFDSIEINP